MTEMVERVALAISGGDDPSSILEIHRYRARLAIQAMREPTKGMLEAGTAADWVGEEESRAGDSILPSLTNWNGEEFGNFSRPGIWTAMIDAALSE